MHIPGFVSLVFLLYLLAVLPWIAIRGAGLLRAAREGRLLQPLPSRTTIWVQTIIAQVLLFALAWYTGRQFDFRIFALPAIGAREAAAALVALAAHFGLYAISRAVYSEAERRRMLIYFLAPRTLRERLAWTVTVLVASVAEEAAYRGVGMSILWYSLGNPYAAAGVCAVAFALAHWTQGWKSAAIIFVMALVMHGLVAFTGTLVLAMAVHAIYDFAAGYLVGREAADYDRQLTSPGLEAPTRSE
jgi:membrane protease YdiL (CAAX protease family)